MISEHQRHRLFSKLEEQIGPEAASTMMELLPSVGWADDATKHDVHNLERRMDRLEQRFDSLEDAVRSSTRTYVAWLLASHAGLLAAVGLPALFA